MQKRKDYLGIPRNPYEVLYTENYNHLINDDVFLQLIWESYAWSVWQFIQVPRRDGYGNIPGKWTDYSGDFPLWRLCYAIQNHFRNKFETEMEWSFQKLFTMPKDMEIPWLTYQQFSNLIGNLTDMIVAEQNWQPMIDEIWNNRQLEDYSERKSSYKRDFINKWYCSWDKKKSPIFLDEVVRTDGEISDDLLIQLPAPVKILKQKFFQSSELMLLLQSSRKKTEIFCRCVWTDAHSNRLQNISDTKRRVRFTNAFRKLQPPTKILFQKSTENFWNPTQKTRKPNKKTKTVVIDFTAVF